MTNSISILKRFVIYVLACTGFMLVSSELIFAQPSGDPVVRLNSEMHTNLISSIDSDAGGDFVLTTSTDRTAKLWDAKSSQLLQTFRVPISGSTTGILLDGVLSPDGKFALVAGTTYFSGLFVIYLFDTQSGELTGYEQTPFKGEITEMDLSSDGRYGSIGK